MAKKNKQFVLAFEKPIVELEEKIAEMREYAKASGLELEADINRLEEKAAQLRKEIYANLNRWQRVQLARHPQRPYALDYIARICPYFEELHGDRRFADDKAIVSGLARLEEFSVVIISQQKGKDTKENLYRNFGMPHPEGYRKALRLMELAAKFNKPVITLIDTPGAYPGIGAEERGQAEAIAYNLFRMARLPVPIINVIIGEGASGGALGIGVGDRILMMENSWYSVISPEGCAAILWRDAAFAPKAAEAMKVTAPDLLNLGVIDEIIKEPEGGAHRDYDAAAKAVKEAILKHLRELVKIPTEKLLEQRMEKFSKMGAWVE
ncbi:acetyl-CoA carboxylase carboxyl transferase subunit alpha [candidate division KSB1 bacterium]|jgi:acetyl-CoA carboxylase carboxyl transferase subunit alpha|nr:MAG: acetyl-CoA carboxylase carboxyl transferase subunit alpha [candidate division KSB1 bacterium]